MASSWSVTVGRAQGSVVVTVCGHLDPHSSKELGTILADLIDGQGNLSVVVDLRQAAAIDPDCLWMLTEAAERAYRRGGTMKFDADPGVLRAALELRGLDLFVGEA